MTARHRRARLHRRVLAWFRARRQARQVEAARDDAYVVRIEAHSPPPLATLAATLAAYSEAIAAANGLAPAAVLPDEDVPGLDHLKRPDYEFDTGQWPIHMMQGMEP